MQASISGTVIGRLRGSQIVLTAAHGFLHNKQWGGGKRVQVCTETACYVGSLVFAEKASDLAVIRLLGRTNLPCAPVAASNAPKGSKATLLGYPEGSKRLRSVPTTVVSYQGIDLVHDRHMAQGDSGGGIFVNGELVGMHNAEEAPSEESRQRSLQMFAVSATEIRRFLNQRLGGIPVCGDVPPPTEPLPPPPVQPVPPIARMPRLGSVTVKDLAPGTTPYGRWKPVGDVVHLELGIARGARGKRGPPGASPDLEEIERRLAALEGKTISLRIMRGDKMVDESTSYTLGSDGNRFIAIDLSELEKEEK